MRRYIKSALHFEITKSDFKNKKWLISKRLLCVFALVTALMVARAFSNLFCYAVLGVCGLVILTFTLQESINLLVYVLPFSSILKLDESGMSFFTFLFFALLLRVVVFNNRFDVVSILSVALFSVYSLVFSGLEQLTTIITIAAALILIKKIDSYHIDAQAVVVSFSLGLCVSSVVALFRNNLPMINRFLSSATLKLGEGEFADRFAALEGNPNYFTLGVNFAIACLVVIMLREKPRIFHFILIGALTWFGLKSISQSFLLGYAVLVVLWFISVASRGGASSAIKFLVLGAILAGLVYFFASDSIDVFIRRFSNEEGASLNTISTGRFGIWQTYIEEIFHSPRILMFGSGLNSMGTVGRGTHNTYFEAIYALGFFGIAMLIFALKKAFEGIRINLLFLMPLSVILVRMMGIGILTYDNFWIYLILLKILGLSLKKSDSMAGQS